MTTKPRYRVPTCAVYHDVSLDEFDVQDIRKYLAHIDCTAGDATEYEDPADRPKPAGLNISGSDMDRIATLALCGQRDAARELVLQIVGDAIGRAL